MKNHKHQWGDKFPYWYTKNGLLDTYTLKRQSGAEPVWIQECSICHTVKHTPRKLITKNMSVGMAKTTVIYGFSLDIRDIKPILDIHKAKVDRAVEISINFLGTTKEFTLYQFLTLLGFDQKLILDAIDAYNN